MMTIGELKAAFERHSDEYLEFERIAHPRHPRPDLCAFLMLHDLAPGTGDLVADATHDEVFLSVDPKVVAKKITDDMVRDLCRCGVRFSREHDSFAMFT